MYAIVEDKGDNILFVHFESDNIKQIDELLKIYEVASNIGSKYFVIERID
jgi:hypothetical protein